MQDPEAEKPQIDKFRDLARQLECDEDEAAFEGVIRRIAPSKDDHPGKKSEES